MKNPLAFIICFVLLVVVATAYVASTDSPTDRNVPGATTGAGKSSLRD